jgi:DNA-binding transcriptional ArsR family regulator
VCAAGSIVSAASLMKRIPLRAYTGASGNVTSFACRPPNGSQMSDGMNVKSGRGSSTTISWQSPTFFFSSNVAELQTSLGASQQNISKHLGILHNAGMVTRTKDGNHARYSIADEGVFELCEQVCGGVRRQLNQLDALLQRAPGQ